MFADLILERVERRPDRPALGDYPASHDVCPPDCCLPAPRPQGRPAAATA